jgi:ATP-dependent DNA helicase PIF1
LNHSYLWKSIRKLKLETNVRAEKVGDSSTKEEIRNWSKFLLDVGEGKIGQINKNKFHESKSTEELINFVYPNYQINESNILVSQLNKDVNKINEYMLSQFQGEEYTFLSIDSVSDETKSTEFPSEFLNSVNVSSLPDHELKLKIGAPITLLRNINPSQGLCNGTRMIVKKVKTHAILAEIISGGYKTQQHWIPKISLISDENLPFEMKRYQFPVKLSFCITAHKAQGQTFNRIGIYLNQNPFCHGILYVLLSRVSRKENISIFSKMETIENTVYSEVLNQ